jgi:hypothetical protein
MAMFTPITRRDFVKKTLQAGTLAGLSDYAFLKGLGPVSAREAKLSPGMVQLHADIEPLVKLIEETDRAKLLEVVAGRLRQGLSYGQLLAGVLLAGVRGIQPRPVGFKFHAVLVINSAHLASLAAADSDRWLPLFWALDNFKQSQEQNRKEGNWAMRPVEESKLPPAAQARKYFQDSMDDWNVEGADVAVTTLVRTAGAGEISELFWRYGARDFRDIGHKAIYAANSWRTLQAIGWRHAEPVMRSLAYALLEHKGDNPARRDAEEDRPWRENLSRAAKIRADWQIGELQPSATTDLLASFRTATPGEACDHMVKVLNNKVSPASIWDALFLYAGELIMRQPGIVGIHCVTSTNALHFAYQASGNDETRRMLMLQGAAFLCLFRKAMAGRGALREDLCIDTLDKAELKSHGADAIDEIFADVSRDRLLAARKTLALLAEESPAAQPLMTAGRRLIFNKGKDSHDYKFSSAALEDYYQATPAWRARYLATSMFNLKGAADADNKLIKRTREAFGA